MGFSLLRVKEVKYIHLPAEIKTSLQTEERLLVPTSERRNLDTRYGTQVTERTCRVTRKKTLYVHPLYIPKASRPPGPYALHLLGRINKCVMMVRTKFN